VKLVRAGAPPSLLWADPRATNLDELPYGSPLEQAVAEAQAEYQRRLARRGWSFRRISYVWSALGRLRFEWPLHMPPLGRVDR
jgi:hypothetical protein